MTFLHIACPSDVVLNLLSKTCVLYGIIFMMEFNYLTIS